MARRVQELLRLTGALRAFGDVIQDFSNEEGVPLSKVREKNELVEKNKIGPHSHNNY